MKIKRDQLIRTIGPLVSLTRTVKALEDLRLIKFDVTEEKTKVSACNGDIFYLRNMTSNGEPFSFALNADTLYNLLNNMSENEIEIEKIDDMVKVSSKHTEARIKTYKENELFDSFMPTSEELSDVVCIVKTEGIIKTIKRVAFCAGISSKIPDIKVSISPEEIKSFGSSESVFAMSKIRNKSPKKYQPISIIISSSSADSIFALDEEDTYIVDTGTSWIFFNANELLKINKIEENPLYDKIEELISSTEGTEVVTTKSDLLQIIEDMEITMGEEGNRSKVYNDGNTVIFDSESNSNNDEFDLLGASMRFESKNDIDDDFSVMINGKRIAECTPFLSEGVTIKASKMKMLLESSNASYLIAGMRKRR